MRRLASFVQVLLVAIAAFWCGLELYRGYLARLSRGPTPTGPTTTAALPAVPGPPGPLPEATRKELDALQSTDFYTREQACWTLRERRVTEAYRGAVEQAASRPENQGLKALLACLRARFPEREALEAALQSLPKEESGYRMYGPGLACLLRVVGERADEAPERIRDILLPAAVGGNFSNREVAIRGLERIDLPTLPDWLVQRAQSDPNGRRRELALEAAIALGAGELDLDLLEQALSDPSDSVQRAASRGLVDSRQSAAARMIARRLLDEPESRERLGLLRSREQSQHDVSAALAEVALDETAPVERRQTALSILGTHGDPGAVSLLEPLLRSGSEPVRAYARAAIDQLRNSGRDDQLRRLNP